MSDKPTHMAEPLVLATLQGRKKVTRRPIRNTKPEDELVSWDPITGRAVFCIRGGTHTWKVNAPYVAHDRLYVRERARVLEVSRGITPLERVRLRYEADGVETGWLDYPDRLVTPASHACIANGCYREACRLWLPLTEVRPERLHAMTDEDALAEGVEHAPDPDVVPRDRFRWLWSELYGESNYCSNPWVWVIRWANPEIRQVAA